MDLPALTPGNAVVVYGPPACGRTKLVYTMALKKASDGEKVRVWTPIPEERRYHQVPDGLVDVVCTSEVISKQISQAALEGVRTVIIDDMDSIPVRLGSSLLAELEAIIRKTKKAGITLVTTMKLGYRYGRPVSPSIGVSGVFDDVWAFYQPGTIDEVKWSAWAVVLADPFGAPKSVR